MSLPSLCILLKNSAQYTLLIHSVLPFAVIKIVHKPVHTLHRSNYKSTETASPQQTEPHYFL